MFRILCAIVVLAGLVEESAAQNRAFNRGFANATTGRGFTPFDGRFRSDDFRAGQRAGYAFNAALAAQQAISDHFARSQAQALAAAQANALAIQAAAARAAAVPYPVGTLPSYRAASYVPIQFFDVRASLAVPVVSFSSSCHY